MIINVFQISVVRMGKFFSEHIVDSATERGQVVGSGYVGDEGDESCTHAKKVQQPTLYWLLPHLRILYGDSQVASQVKERNGIHIDPQTQTANQVHMCQTKCYCCQDRR